MVARPGVGVGFRKVTLLWSRPSAGQATACRSYNDVLDGPPADGAAGPGLPLEPQAAAVAQAHVSTRVDDCVHFAIEAHRALAVLAAHQLRWGEHGGHWWAQWGAGGRHCRKGEQADLNPWLSGGLCWGNPKKAGLLWQNPWGDNFGRHQFWLFSWVLPPFLRSYPQASSTIISLWDATSRCFSSLQLKKERMRGKGSHLV